MRSDPAKLDFSKEQGQRRSWTRAGIRQVGIRFNPYYRIVHRCSRVLAHQESKGRGGELNGLGWGSSRPRANESE